jgi:3-oxoacyl-[acyl-carrier-protein] synthase-3
VAAEKYSSIIDPCDRGTAPIFADGAAAVLLRGGRPGEPGAVLAIDWGSDGGGSDLVAIPAGGSRNPATGSPAPEEFYFRMRGGQVYAHAVRRMTQSAQAALAATGWKAQDVEAFIGHQANQRILDSVAERLGIDARNSLGNIRDVGNTAAASIPLALADAVSRGARHPSAPTLLTAFGGGLTWASATLNWPGAPVFQAEAQPIIPRSESKEHEAL